MNEKGLKSISDIINIPIINTQYKKRVTMTELGFEIEEHAYTDEIGLPLRETLNFLINGNIDLISKIEKTHFGIKIPFHDEIHIKLNKNDSINIEKLKQLLKNLILLSQKDKDYYQKLNNDYDHLIQEMTTKLQNITYKTELKFKLNTCEYLIP